MKKRKFLDAAEQNEEMSLQITSMADIFTIILVFLLKSYSAGVANASPAQGMILPEGRTPAVYKDTLKVEILKEAVLVDDRSATSLKNFAFPQTGPQDVTQALMRQRQKTGIPDSASQLLLLADQRTPYSTLKGVMNSAAQAGFVDLQLVVIQAE